MQNELIENLNIYLKYCNQCTHNKRMQNNSLCKLIIEPQVKIVHEKSEIYHII